MSTAEICGSAGGTGIGAAHSCVCTMPAGHPPVTTTRAHGCRCGALWNAPRPSSVETSFLHEVTCPACGATIRARMADADDPVADQYPAFRAGFHAGVGYRPGDLHASDWQRAAAIAYTRWAGGDG